MLANLDQLTLWLGGFFGLLLLIAIGGLFYLIRYLRRERAKRAWRSFAAANSLAFKPGRLPEGAFVTGSITGQRLTLRSQGNRTRMTLAGDLSRPVSDNNEAAVEALVNALAAIYHSALTQPALRHLHDDMARHRPAIFEFIRFVWRFVRGRSLSEAMADDDPAIDPATLKKFEPLLRDLNHKIFRAYGVDSWPLFQAAVPRSPFTPDYTTVGRSAKGTDIQETLENFQASFRDALAASFSKGQVALGETRQAITYRQDSLETDGDYLQRIFDLLASLARGYPFLLDMGGDLLPFLREAAIADSDLGEVVRQLIRDIAAETETRLGQQPDRFLCVRCLTHCGPHKLTVPTGQTFIYYGCRTCRQSRNFFEGEAIMLLDRAYRATEPIQADGKLRVNWFAERSLFDFDSVEIIEADDEAVERFAVQVGNDTDPVRQPRYAAIRCLVSPQCRLSENSLRILEKTFGTVVIQATNDPA